jgi:hypothetical protein
MNLHRLCSAAALLLPADPGFPAAKDPRLADSLAPLTVLGARVSAALELLGEPSTAALHGLEVEHPAEFDALLELVIVIWATGPDVQALVPANDPIPLDRLGISAELLAPVLARGPRWQRTGDVR